MKPFIPTVILLGAISIGIWSLRQSQLKSIRADATQARAQQAELGPSRQRLTGESEATVDSRELERLRALRPELARLRGSIGTLRQHANETPEQLEGKAKQAHDEADLIRARRQAKARSRAMSSSIGQCLMLLSEAAFNTDGILPKDWNEVRARLTQTPAGARGLIPHLKGMIERESGPQGMLAQFEILPTSAAVRFKRDGPPPQTPVIREVQPRPQPDGGAARYYAWLDGRTEEITLPDGNFTLWETQHLASAK